jgi:hypothetical protein
MACAAQADCAVIATVLAGNSMAGAVAFDHATSLTLSHTAIFGTSLGMHLTGATFGDGLVAAAEATMDAAQCLVRDNARAGVFYDHAKGAFEGNAVSGNMWALAIQDSLVDWVNGVNDLTCNEHPGMSSPGLTEPEPPDLSPSELLELPEPPEPQG